MIEREITGKHVLIGTVAAFSVIIAVNVTMAVKAVGTFPGLEVKNSYVASQSFEARRDAQEALGWTVTAQAENGFLDLVITDKTGQAVRPDNLTGMIGRPTISRDDQTLVFAAEAGVLRAPVDLGTGAWIIKLNATAADGTPFAKRIDLWVK